MREFARIAIAEGLTLGRLAARLNRRDHTTLKAINVTRHFEATYPREATVESYAGVLDVRESHIAFVRGDYDRIPRTDVEEALRRAIGHLNIESYQFRNKAAARAADAIQESLQHDPTESMRIAAVFALAQMREEHGVLDDCAAKHPSFTSVVGPALSALAHHLRPRVDLFAELEDDARLAELQLVLARLFVGEASGDIDHVMDFVLRLLGSRGIDTSAMEEALDRKNRQSWRIGDFSRRDYSLDLERRT
jgi:hypothetical protein